MTRKILLSSLFVLATTASALAADLPSRVAPPPYIPVPIFTWTGLYVGGQAGYEWGTNNSRASGFVGGGHLGYNYQINQFVLGIEGDINGLSYKNSALFPVFATAFSTKIPVDGSIRGRVGVAFDRALFYATGGVALAEFHDTFVTPISAPTLSHNRVGWTVGAGVEYAVTNNWSIRAEYRYTDFGQFTDSNSQLPFVLNRHPKDNRVQAGFSYKFDTYAPPAPVVAKY